MLSIFINQEDISKILMQVLNFYTNYILVKFSSNIKKESIVKKVGNRIVACIIVFCIPTIIKLLFFFIRKC